VETADLQFHHLHLLLSADALEAQCPLHAIESRSADLQIANRGLR
jgi:hypothetical protein